MGKTPDIGADTNPFLVVEAGADAVPVTETHDPLADVLEPLAEVIDAVQAEASTVTVPVSAPTPMPGLPATKAPAATVPRAPAARRAVDPFAGNPLQGRVASHKPRRTVWIASVAVHLVFAAAVLLIPQRAAHDAEAEPIEIAFYSPEALQPKPAVVPEPLPEPEVVEPEPEPVPEPVVAAKVEPPPAPEPVVADVRPPEPEPVAEPVPQPELPRPQVQTNVLAKAEPAPQPAKRPKRTAQLAGFTRAETVAVEDSPADRQLARAGAFGAEPEPQPVAPAGRPDNRVVAAGQFSDGPITVPRTGDKQRRGTVSTATFTETPKTAEPQPKRQREVVTGNGFAATEAAAPAQTTTRERGSVTSIDFGSEATVADATPQRGGSVSRGGFGDGEAAAPTPRKRQRPATDLDTPVEILSKTNPVYTDAARKLRVEGEVVLEVLFSAGGELRILRVVDGLGHGLDEAAVTAAQKIEFKPARQDGRTVDYTATIRVVFRLA